MRTPTTAQEAALRSPQAGRWIRVRVADYSATLQDLSALLGFDWLVSASWGEDVDARGVTADIEIRRDRYNDSLAPGRTGARANLIGGGVLLALRRAIIIDAAVMPAGIAPASGDWVEVFRGQIDSIDWAADPIHIACRDQIAPLQDRIIETEATYGSSGGTASETVIQNVIDDTLGSGVVTLYTPTSPGWLLLEYNSEQQSLLDEISKVSDQIGWQLRYKWDSGTSAFRLTFYAPDRTKSTVDRTFTADQYFDFSTLSIAIDDIRNVIPVTWSDPTSLDSSGQPVRSTVTATNSASVTSYGRRVMPISEAATSAINTLTEAQTLADNCLSDLAEPTAILAVDMLFFPFVDLDDRYTFVADGYHSDTDITLTVVGFRHTVSVTSVKTQLQLRGSVPTRGTTSWLNMGGTNGIAPKVRMYGPLADAMGMSDNIGNLLATMPKTGPWVDRFEIHAGTSGFIPNIADLTSTVIGSTRGSRFTIVPDLTKVPIGEPIDICVYPMDIYGNRGTYQRFSGHTARRSGPQLLAELARTGGGFRGGTFSAECLSRGDAWGPDGWDIIVGTWLTDVSLDDGGTYTLPETGDRALLLADTPVATALNGDLIPVATGRRYCLHCRYKANSLAYNVYIGVKWMSAGLATLATDYLTNSAVTSVDKWQSGRLQGCPPDGAVYAQLIIAKSADAYFVAVDRVIFEEVASVETVASRYQLRDDFTRVEDDRIGDLDWTPQFIGADLTNITSAPVSAPSPLTGSWNWSTPGVVVVTTPDVGGTAVADYGTIIRIGSEAAPPFYGMPPVGYEFRARVRILGANTQIIAWIGLWSAETYPDGGAVNVQSGIGVIVRRVGTTGTWYAVARDGTSETAEDLGENAGAGWVDIGFRVTESGIQGLVDGLDAGAEIVTDLPTGGLMPQIGVYTTNSSAKSLEVDLYLIHGDTQR